jgi:hypothetical protein
MFAECSAQNLTRHKLPRQFAERGLDPYLETKKVTVSLDPPAAPR